MLTRKAMVKPSASLGRGSLNNHFSIFQGILKASMGGAGKLEIMKEAKIGVDELDRFLFLLTENGFLSAATVVTELGAGVHFFTTTKGNDLVRMIDFHFTSRV